MALVVAVCMAQGVVSARANAAALSPDDVETYRTIISLQTQGRWDEADARIATLQDRLLMGHVLFQRYMHPTAYRSKFRELSDWMAEYADHPGAERIYDLALRRRPEGAARPRKPSGGETRIGVAHAGPPPYRSTRQLNGKDRTRARQIQRQIRYNVLHTRFTVSEQLLATREAQQLLDQVEIDQAHADVARGWFHYGNDEKALALAGPAAERSGSLAPMAHWIAGLAAWRLQRLDESVRHFSGAAKAARATTAMRAAGAYWAARAYLRLRRPQEMSGWLALAAAQGQTFYALLAKEALGIRTRSISGAPSVLTPAQRQTIGAYSGGRRALALMEIGRPELAEAEIKRLPLSSDPDLAAAVLLFAEQSGMPALAFRLANHLLGRSDAQDLPSNVLEAGLYPLPTWTPESGYRVDRALIFALVRRESRFDPTARSRDGARGLMQLMPSTARYVAGGRVDRQRLHDPEANLELGQRYIAYLLTHPNVKGDLFALAAAYNAGPGNLGRWRRNTRHHDDPLLFIESLPSRETRLFIERVLTNLWIYRARLDQPAPSLKEVAAGHWPRYWALDARVEEIARNVPRPKYKD